MQRFRELDARESDGETVALLWDSELDTVIVRVIEDGECVGMAEVSPENAKDAFNHPWVYAKEVASVSR